MFRRSKMHTSINAYVRSLTLGAAAAALAPGLTLAQESGGEGRQPVLEEIFVTGTLIRGVDPVGSQAIGIDSETVTDSGVITTNELLGTLPQVSNFFNQRPEQDPRNATRQTINRPNLRNLPGFNSSSGSTTLVLVDSHRITPVGVAQSSVDPDLIPASVIERVEVITDGGSSLYGADAVGGVINFVTRKEFDGVQIDVNMGAGDDFDTTNASLIAGTSWDGGSGYISLSTTERKGVENRDRDWSAAGNWDEEGITLTPDGTECLSPVGVVTTWAWYGAGWTANPRASSLGVKETPVGEPCDVKGASSLLSNQDRDNVYLGLTHSFSDNVTLDVKAYYAERTTTLGGYPLGDTVTGADPNTLGVTGTAVGDTFDVSAVGFSYGAHSAYHHRESEVELETWGITPELTIDFDNGWRLRNTLHYGTSDSSLTVPSSNRALLLENITAVDPGNIARADAGLISNILDWENAQEATQELFFVRTIADGTIFEISGGEVRAAVGLEYAEDRAKKREADVTIGGLSAVPYKRDNRDVGSAYAELSIPVTSRFDLSLSARYDDYRDFGDTTNSNIGFNFEVTDWLTIYGHWGESFNAPTVLDSLGVAFADYVPSAAPTVPDPLGVRDPARVDVFHVQGASGALLPQTAETWAVGFEIHPTGVEGLHISANYYEIDFDDLLGAPNPQITQAVLLNPDKFLWNPTQELLDEFIAGIEGGAEQFADINVDDIGLILDRRVANTDAATLKGFDFSLNYMHETDLGLMGYGVSGNHETEFDLIQNGTAVDQLKNNVSDTRIAANISMQRENLRARLSLKYSNGFDTDVGVNQTSVNSFLVTDLFVGYEFAADSGPTEGLSIRFNVDNIFDEDPPEWRRQGNPNYTGFTLGRVFKLGITKKF